MSVAPLPFTLRQLQYVVAIADTLNFRRAAQACSVSQPSLSAQLAELEAAVGLTLFERDRRGVLTTAAGEAFVARARALLLDGAELVTLSRALTEPLAGVLRLGIIPTLSPYLLPALTPALRRAWPKLVPRWSEDKTSTLLASLRSGALDAVVLALEAELGEVEREVLAVDPFVLATREDDPLGKGRGPVTRAELKDAEVLLLDDGHCFRAQALSFCSKVKAHELEFRATSLSTLAQMVAGGAGVTLLPKLAVATEVPRAGLRTRPFAEPVPSRTIALVWRPGSALAPSLRQLAASMRVAWPRG